MSQAYPLELPDALVQHPLAPYILDKAIKALAWHHERPSSVVFNFSASSPSSTLLPIIAESARHGLLCHSGSPPEIASPLRCLYRNKWLDLSLQEPLDDWHAHTQFAYCGRGIDLFDAARLAHFFGIRTQGFSEHAFALYFPSDALKFYWQADLDLVARTWGSSERGRMLAYKTLAQTIRPIFGKRIRMGLEVDLLSNGQLCLAPQDQNGWDMLIGAIHEIPDIQAGNTQAETEYAWMRDIERLLESPIQILAHPFRYWTWSKRPVPRHFYRPVAKLLAKRHIAAEINHHKNPFELEFYRICLEEGVQLSLGSDAHITRDIADLTPHLETLKALGLTTQESRSRHLLQDVPTNP